MIQLDIAPSNLLAQTFRGLSYLSRLVHTFRFFHLIQTKFTDVKVPPDHGALELTARSKNMNTYSKDRWCELVHLFSSIGRGSM